MSLHQLKTAEVPQMTDSLGALFKMCPKSRGFESPPAELPPATTTVMPMSVRLCAAASSRETTGPPKDISKTADVCTLLWIHSSALTTSSIDPVPSQAITRTAAKVQGIWMRRCGIEPGTGLLHAPVCCHTRTLLLFPVHASTPLVRLLSPLMTTNKSTCTLISLSTKLKAVAL